MNLNQEALGIYGDNKRQGFWDSEVDQDFGTKIALMHSELSEALEEYRDGRKFTEIYYRADGKPEGILVELADTVIRILDFVGSLVESDAVDFEHIINEKLNFNRSRPFRHGKQL